MQTDNGWNGKTVSIHGMSKLVIEPYPIESKQFVMTRTPLRLPLGGGGTDLLEYYTKHKHGFWISAAINYYIYIVLKRRFEEESKFVYSQTQYVKDPSQFSHPILREVLTKYKLVKHIELVSTGDLPSRIGLGSSGTFTVGLLNAVHTFLGNERAPQDLAEEAYEIERFELGRRIGKQDQYVAAYGSINSYEVNHQGDVVVCPLRVPDFQKWLLLFYVDRRRVAADAALMSMTDIDRDKIAAIGKHSVEALLDNDFQTYGELMDLHWQVKKQYQPLHFDTLINVAKSAGAIGGKMCGAGGGGCVLLVCPPDKQHAVITAMQTTNSAIHIPFNFELFGSEVY